MVKNPLKEFTKFEAGLWAVSSICIIVLFIVNPHRDVLTLVASLVGVTALIYVAKGDVKGQLLTILFSLIYAVISYKFRYYGEMITYLGMTAPIALLSTISWLRNPYEHGKGEVKIAHLTPFKVVCLIVLTIVVTVLFYFILRYFDTANLLMSTVSIATSFLASSLMFMRSTYYAVAYACNDIVLIVLWVLASINDLSFLPMVLCFVIFFVNDIYGFISWQKMKKRQGGL